MRRTRIVLAVVIVIALLAWGLYAWRHREPGHLDKQAASELFTRVKVDAAPGLSGLALDGDDRLWTVAERGHHAYRLTLGGDKVKGVETFTVAGVPPETDLESVAWLAPGLLAIGTEGPVSAKATILITREAGDQLVPERTINLPDALVGVTIRDNAGAEGLCGAGDVLIAGLETVGIADGRRFAPLVRINLAQPTASPVLYRLWLTSPTGKLSSLDCSLDADGTARVVAIERHFEVSRFLTFRLSPAGPRDVAPDQVEDLSAILRGSLNLEGIVRRDGHWIVINDNQAGGKVEGKSTLLSFKKPAP